MKCFRYTENYLLLVSQWSMLFSRPKFQYMVLISQKSCTWNDQEYVESDQEFDEMSYGKAKVYSILALPVKETRRGGKLWITIGTPHCILVILVSNADKRCTAVQTTSFSTANSTTSSKSFSAFKISTCFHEYCGSKKKSQILLNGKCI